MFQHDGKPPSIHFAGGREKPVVPPRSGEPAIREFLPTAANARYAGDFSTQTAAIGARLDDTPLLQ
jgi:hypothetical protein